MLERKINLEEILTQYTAISKIDCDEMCYKNGVIEAMMDFGKQLLILASENAEILRDDFNYDSQIWETEIVDKQSILDTIKQVE